MKPFSENDFIIELKDMISSLTKIPREEISLDDELREDIGMDSMQSMELLSRISETWDVDVEIDEIMSVRTVADIVTFIKKIYQAA